MNHWKTLYGYELRKLLGRKLLWVTFCVLLGIVLLTSLRELVESHTEREGQRVTDYEYNAAERAAARRASGLALNEEEIFNAALSESTRWILEDAPEGWDIAAYRVLHDYTNRLFPGVQAPLINWGQGYEIWLEQKDTLHLADKLYAQRRSVVQTAWEAYCLPAAQQAYWQQREEALPQPFVYQYAQGWQNILGSVASLDILTLLLAAIGLAAAFAEETQLRTDQMLLSSRYGRGLLYTAKWLAGATVVLALQGVLIAVTVGVYVALYGADGAGGVIQLWMPFIARNLTFAQAAAVYGALLLLAALLYSALTLFLSLLLQNAAAVLAAAVGPLIFCYFCSFLPQKGVAGVFAQLWDVIPTKLLHRQSLSDPRLVPFPLAPGGYLTNLQLGLAAYPLITLLLAWGGWQLWRRHQIKGR